MRMPWERGPVYALPRRTPKLPKAWFYKPYLFTLCRSEKVLAIDLDCEIRGSIRPVFDLIGDTPVAAKDRVVIQEYRHLFARDCHFNSGVVGAPRDHPLILEWGRLCLERHLEFRSDQEILNLALYFTPSMSSRDFLAWWAIMIFLISSSVGSRGAGAAE